MNEINAGQLDAILEICQQERLFFYLEYTAYSDRISVGARADDRARAGDSGVRGLNRYSNDPIKALGRLHEELGKRHFGAPQPIWDAEKLAAVIDSIIATKPGGFTFGANFFQRGTRPYFYARTYSMSWESIPRSNDAVWVCQQVLEQLKK